MHEHIAKCYAEDLAKNYADLFQTAILGETFRSPIGFNIPKIPVRIFGGPKLDLPGAKQVEVNKVYDLVEFLILPE